MRHIFYILVVFVLFLTIINIFYFFYIKNEVKTKLENLKFIEGKLEGKGIDIFVKLNRYLSKLEKKGLISKRKRVLIYNLVVFYLKYGFEDILVVYNNKKIIKYLDNFYKLLVNDLVDTK